MTITVEVDDKFYTWDKHHPNFWRNESGRYVKNQKLLSRIVDELNKPSTIKVDGWDRFNLLHKKISNLVEAKFFIEELWKHDLLFHFDDDPFDIIGTDGLRTFTDLEASAIVLRVEELFAQNWGEYECPHGYALFIMESDIKEVK